MLNRRHKSLVAWQRADDLLIRVHKIAIHSFPRFERFAYCIHAGWRLGDITEAVLKELEKDLNGVGAPVSGLIRSIRLSQAFANATAVVLCIVAVVFLWQ